MLIHRRPSPIGTTHEPLTRAACVWVEKPFSRAAICCRRHLPAHPALHGTSGAGSRPIAVSDFQFHHKPGSSHANTRRHRFDPFPPHLAPYDPAPSIRALCSNVLVPFLIHYYSFFLALLLLRLPITSYTTLALSYIQYNAKRTITSISTISHHQSPNFVNKNQTSCWSGPCTLFRRKPPVAGYHRSCVDGPCVQLHISPLPGFCQSRLMQ